MAGTEIELKLSLDALGARKLRRDPAIHAYKKGRARNRKLFAVYFDTQDLALRNAKSALRIRQEGPVRLQTLKVRIEGSVGALQTRREIEAVTTGDVPDLSLIDDDDARAVVASLTDGKPLLPVFVTDISRTIWDIAWGDSEIEMVLDEGEVRSGKRSVPVCEAELEMKGGNVSDLLSFARDLSKRNIFQVSDDTKASRGYLLFQNGVRKPEKAQVPTIQPNDSAWSVFSAMLGAATDQIIANQTAVMRGEDPEGVHQARVAVRRARALLTAYRPLLKDGSRARLAKRLGWLQVALGPARDWDVLLDETIEPLVARHADHAGLKAFRKKAWRARELAYEAARDAITSQRYGRLQLRLMNFGLTPHPRAEAQNALDYGATLLEGRLAVVLNDGGEDPRALPEQNQHALRIEIKKLRYALEFFEPLYGTAAKPMVRAAKKLQDCLGALNDAVVARALIEQIAPAGDPLDPETEALIQTDFDNRIETGLNRLTELWGVFRAVEPFWR